MHAIILTALAAMTAAMPSYIAVPADQIAFLDLTALRLRRVPRQTLAPPPPPPQLPQALYDQDYQPIPLQQYQQQPAALAPPPETEGASSRYVRVQNQPQDVTGAATLGGNSHYAERPPDFGEFVDFGAHTGDNGAFGWYADFPHAIILTALAAMTAAMPSYIAVPADQIAFLDLTALRLRRVPRQTLAPPPPPPQLPQALYDQDYQPIPLQQYQQQPAALAPPPETEGASSRYVRVQNQPQDVTGAATLGGNSHYAERPPDFGEFVDFGAHTGDNGAFGWYADFPVDNHESSAYRK